MATLKSAAEAPSPVPGTLKFQTWVLKVPIHCQGCQKKVKKVLQSIDGVYVTTVDAQQHKVTVTGNVTSEILINKLIKSGKHAELCPNSTPKNTNNNNNNSQKKEKNNNNKQAGGAKLANKEEESAKEQKDPKQKAAKDSAVDKPPAEETAAGPNPKKKKKKDQEHPGPGGSGSDSQKMMIESLDHNQSRPYPGLYAYPPYPPPMYYGPPPFHNHNHHHNLHGVNYNVQPPVVYYAHTPQLPHNAHPPFHGFHKDHDDHGNGDEEDCGCSVM